MTDRALDSVCARIAKARAASGLTQHEAAVRLGVHPTQLSRWENSIVPSVESLVDIARVLGVSVEWLATGEGRGPAESQPAA